MSNPFLNIERGGHRLMMDEKDGYFRVVCNGAIYATFNIATVGEIAALKLAVGHAEAMEANCLVNPKS